MSSPPAATSQTAIPDVVMEDAAQQIPGRIPGLVLTKLHPPALRSEALPRDRLLDLLRDGSERKLTVVAAPAGSGKTTMLSAWCEAETAAWVTLDDGDNDPAVLWAHVIEALRGVCPAVDEGLAETQVGAEPIVEVVLPRLVNILAGQDQLTLVLDDFHHVSVGAARDSVVWFAEHVPLQFRLVVSTRTEPAFPLSRLRAHGDLLEIHADDLQFTSDEAGALLNDVLGLDLEPGDVETLVERTEGWPAGLYLAALSLRRADDPHALVASFGATHRHIIDFLLDEVLAAHDPATQTLMIRSSILGRLSSPLCDALLEPEHGGQALNELARTNLFLVSLDDTGEWYRFHHLFGQLLQTELKRREPSLVAELHRRAYEWHLAYGTTEEAVHHALEAGANSEATELIASMWLPYSNIGRCDTVLAWLDGLPRELTDQDPRVQAVKAWLLSLVARYDEAAICVQAADAATAPDAGPLPDGFSSVEASLLTLRATFPGGDVGAQLEHALGAAALEADTSPWRPVVCWGVGWGMYHSGRFAEADGWFEECIAAAPAGQQWIVAGSALGYRSLIAGLAGRLEDQAALAEEADRVARDYLVDDVAGLGALALGLARAEQGLLDEALPLTQRAVDVFRPWGQPIDLAHALLLHAPVLRASGAEERAAAAIAEVRSIIEECPDPGVLPDRLAELDGTTQPKPRSVPVNGDELTERERTVLRLLSGPLSEREIGRELYVSHNTVHSHTKSIYSKLGASSRDEALKRAREIGAL